MYSVHADKLDFKSVDVLDLDLTAIITKPIWNYIFFWNHLHETFFANWKINCQFYRSDTCQISNTRKHLLSNI